MTFLLFLAVGALAGLLAGLFGIGGGMVIVPVLVLTFQAQSISPDVLTHMAVATSLATIVFTSISSIREHHRNGAVLWPIFKIMASGIILGTALGVALITQVPGPILQKLIGVFSLLLAIKMFFDLNPGSDGRQPGKVGLISAGGIIGFGSSWFGIGGGTFTVPYLSWMKIPMRKAVATSAACGLPIALTGALTNIGAGWNHPDLPQWSTGFLYWPAIAGIVITSVPMAKVGARLAHRLDQQLLKKAFAVVLLVVGIRFMIS